MTLSELERQMLSRGIIAVNVHRIGNGFMVHVRHSLDRGFVCAQRRHDTISDALDEHFRPKNDLSDLLV